MKRPQAIRRSPAEIAGVHQRRAYRLSTTRAQRLGEHVGGAVLAALTYLLFYAALGAGSF